MNPNGVTVFDANTNSNELVRNEMPPTLITRYVRLTAVVFEYIPGLRWKIKGCPVPVDNGTPRDSQGPTDLGIPG